MHGKQRIPMPSVRFSMFSAGIVATVALLGSAAADVGPQSYDATVGVQPDGTVLTPADQLLDPAGTQLEIPGRITGIVVSPNGRTAVAHSASGDPALSVIDLDTSSIVQSYTGASGAGSYDGAAFTPDGRTFLSSGADGVVALTDVGSDGHLGASRMVTIPSSYVPPTACCNQYPGGIASSDDGRTAYVALSRSNSLGVVDLASASMPSSTPSPLPETGAANIAVGNAPHSVLVVGNSAYVTNEGGRPAQPGDYVNDSAGTPIVADSFTGAAITGTVSVVDLTTRTQTTSIAVGLHPTAMLRSGNNLFVANTGSDSVSVIDLRTNQVTRTIAIKPFPDAPYGSQPNALAMLPDGRLAVSLGGDNAVAVIDLGGRQGQGQPARIDGLIPTGWFPAGLAVDTRHHRLLVAAERGKGSLGDAEAGHTQRGVGSEIATVSLVPFPTAGQLRNMTDEVFHLNRWDSIDRQAPRANATPVPVPLHLGEPSTIKHVVYIVKENRTYDQLLGDIGRGNSDPSLAMFGKDVTPNTHALATQFPLLDNFYDSGRRSNDGHQWAMQATSPDYLEKGVSSQRQNYTSVGTPPSSGEDALLYLPSGFIWEDALRHGKTFMDFGEYTTESQPPPARSDKPSLEEHLAPEYLGFELTTPDEERARIFDNYVTTWSAAGTMPDLITLTLPDDHTGGSNPLYPTPTSQVADNDAGLGMIVDSLSHSPFWSSTAVFVIEDDSQGGVDHVDGHRSICLVASPWAKHGGAVDSTYHTQVDVVRTIEQILGIPPMNQSDLAAQPMWSAFSNVPDDTPYAAIVPTTPVSVPNPPLRALSGVQLAWARAMEHQDFRYADSVDVGLLNRDIWYSVRGFNTPYPGDSRVLYPSQVHLGPIGSLGD